MTVSKLHPSAIIEEAIAEHEASDPRDGYTVAWFIQKFYDDGWLSDEERLSALEQYVSTEEELPTTAQLTSHDAIARHIFGGNSTFTIVSKKTSARYTYQVEASNDGEVFFVRLLTGPQNTSDYTYVGIITKHNRTRVKHTAKSAYTPSSTPVAALNWLLLNVVRSGDLSQVEFWHAGTCCCCGRQLTTPESIAKGIGPVCEAKH